MGYNPAMAEQLNPYDPTVRSLIPIEQVMREPFKDDSPKNVLSSVVFYHERFIQELSFPERAIGFGMDQIRNAALAISLELMEGVEPNQFQKSRMIIKPSKLGQAILQLEYSNPNQLPNSEKLYAPESVDLKIVDSENLTFERIIGTRFPLTEITDRMEALGVHFHDGRSRSYANAYNQGRPQTLEDIRLHWRGMRWLFANMLTWDQPGVILPEELDIPLDVAKLLPPQA